jgi:tetratricopeptide (TPR) repeat protein
LARASNLVPTSAWDAYQLARMFTLLGELDAANKLLGGYSRNIGWLTESLMLRADVLMRQAGIIPDPNVEVVDPSTAGINQDPLSELSELAMTIRMQPDAMDVLGGYSYYLEGMAEWYRGDREAGARAFEKAAEIGFRDPALAVKVAKSLLAIGGAAQWAEPILLKYQKVLSENEDYLVQLVKCEAQLKDDRYLLPATKKLYELNPNDPGRVSNYAAALLLVREDPAKALALTLQLLQTFPDNVDVKINHAVALLLNGRSEDALKMLAEIIPENLQPPEATQYYITAFEAYWKLGRLKRAEAALKKVEQNLLYPAQVAWLDEVMPQFQADLDAARQQ